MKSKSFHYDIELSVSCVYDTSLLFPLTKQHTSTVWWKKDKSLAALPRTHPYSKLSDAS